LAAFYGLRHYLYTNAMDSLSRRSVQIEQVLEQAAVDVTPAQIAHEIETRIAPEFNNRFVRISGRDGGIVYRSGPPADQSFDPRTVKNSTPVGMWRGRRRTSAMVGEQHLLVHETTVDAASGSYLVESGVSIAGMEAVLQRLIDLLLLLLPSLTVCAAGGGYALVSRALRPVDQISHSAEQMSLQDLSARLPVVPSGDALERLSTALNGMLGRLSDSVQASRRFLADASHELRTPLTVIKGELQELTAGHPVDARELAERVGSVLEEVDRLEHLVSGLLILSRLDAGEAPHDWRDVDLGDLVSNISDQMRLIADDRGVEIDLKGVEPVVVFGDRSRLKQVIVNLLDNAIRFTARGGRISLATRRDDTATVLEVSDTGIGMPAAALPLVFDRFYRVDEARSRDDGGAGLGLSIVKSICSMHGATVSVQSSPGSGSCFRVKFARPTSAS
jgi:heavy metal sensor kinase